MQTRVPPERFQFSIRHTLVVVTLFALGLGAFSAYFRAEKLARQQDQHAREIARLKRQHAERVSNLNSAHRAAVEHLHRSVEELRRAAGAPDTSIPQRVSSGVLKHPDGSWTIKIHQPVARKLSLCWAIDGIENQGFPTPLGTCPLTVVAGETPAIHACTLRVEPASHGRGAMLSINGQAAPIPAGHLLEGGLAQPGLATTFPRADPVEFDTPSLVVRYRAPGPGASPGLIVWVEDLLGN